MSVSIPFSFTAGTKARASEVNQNFQAVAAKFTEGAGGIADADISTTAGIKGSKLSSVAGNRITQAQLEDDAVDLRVLKDDATGGSPNAAVNTANHIKDAIITNAKLVDATIKKGKLNLASVVVAIPALNNGDQAEVATGLVSTSAFIVGLHSEAAGAHTANSSDRVHIVVHLNTATNAYVLVCGNTHPLNSVGFNVRVWHLAV